jgi:urocanate hydratase
MDQNYAMIENNMVINAIIWNWDTVNNNLNMASNFTLVLIPDSSGVGIGWSYTASGGFTAPPANMTD